MAETGLRLLLARSLRTRVLVLVALAFVAVSVPAYFSFVGIVNATVVRLGTLFAEKQILFDRYRGLSPLMQEVRLAETLARSPAVIEWAKNEADPVARARGLAELEHYREAFADKSYFFVADSSGNYYFNDAANSFAGKQLSHTLSPENPRDAWYYRTATLGEGCHLNVDHDDVLGVTKVWFNCVVSEGGEVLGVLGSGLDLSAFVREVVDIPQTGVTAMFVDRSGAVQAHRDPRLVDFHSFTKSLADKKTIFGLLDRPEDRETLARMLGEVTTSELEVRSAFMQLDGHEVLIGVGYLDRLGWYNVTVMDVDRIIDRGLFLPIGLLLGAIMLLTVLVVGYMFKRLVLDRLARVEARFAAVSDGKFPPGPVDEQPDEIGRMSRAFDRVAASVSDNTTMLERMVAERTDELRRLAYRDQLTGILNRRGFAERFATLTATVADSQVGLLLVDIDEFKDINDQFGHMAGDRVVAEVATRLSRTLGAGDACGRWGGDEFLVVLSDVGGRGLKPLAATIRHRLCEVPVDLGDGREVSLSCSIGAALIEGADGLELGVELADAALYRAKAEGRGRVVVFDPDWAERTLRRA